MVLVLNGVLQDECIPLDTHSLFMQHPIYRDTANQLLSIPSKTVSLKLILFENSVVIKAKNLLIDRSDQ